MPQNFIACVRDQELLLPPSLRDWLPECHLAWFVIDAVAELDLTALYASYRADGHGRAAHDPAMMVALLLKHRVTDAGTVHSSPHRAATWSPFLRARRSDHDGHMTCSSQRP